MFCGKLSTTNQNIIQHKNTKYNILFLTEYTCVATCGTLKHDNAEQSRLFLFTKCFDLRHLRSRSRCAKYYVL